MKPMLRETKENVQGTDSDGKETGTQIKGVDQKEERNIQLEQNEETYVILLPSVPQIKLTLKKR